MSILMSVTLGLLSMLAYGVANVTSKPLALRFGPDRMLYLRGISVCLLLGAVTIPEFHRVPHQVPQAIAALLLGAAGYIPVLAFTHAIRKGRIGIVSPIASTSPLITVLLTSIFLKTQITFLAWIAICVVIAANVFVTIDFSNWKQSNLLSLDSGVPLALVASVGWGIFFAVLVSLAHSLGPWLSAWLVEVGVTTAAGVHIGFKRSGFQHREATHLLLLASAFCIGIGTVAFTVGVRYFNAGIVSGLSNSVALVSCILGALFFEERMQTKEKVAAALMIVGVGAIPLVI